MGTPARADILHAAMIGTILTDSHPPSAPEAHGAEGGATNELQRLRKNVAPGTVHPNAGAPTPPKQPAWTSLAAASASQSGARR